MADENKRETNAGNEENKQPLDIREIINNALASQTVSERLRASAAGISPQNLQGIEELLDRVSQLGKSFKAVADDIRTNLVTAFAGTPEHIGRVIRSYSQFLDVILRMSQKGDFTKSALENLAKKFEDFKETVSSVAEEVVEAQRKSLDEGKNYEQEITQSTIEYLTHRKRIMHRYFRDVATDLGESLTAALRVQRPTLMQAMKGFVGLLEEATRDSRAPIQAFATGIAKSFDFLHNLTRTWVATALDAGKAISWFQEGLLAVSASLTTAGTGLVQVAQWIGQGMDLIKNLGTQLRSYYSTLAQNLDIIRTTIPSFTTLFSVMRASFSYIDRFGLTFEEVLTIWSDMAKRFAIRSMDTFTMLDAPISMLSLRFLKMRLGFEQASDALTSMILATSGAVADAFSSYSTSATDFYRAISMFTATRQLVINMGYAATTINQRFLELVNRMRLFNTTVGQTTTAFSAWLAIFRAVGDTTYMRLDDWLSVLDSLAQQLGRASGATRMFYGILVGFRGIEAYWAGSGFRFSATGGFTRVSEEGYLADVTRGIFNFMRTVIGPITQTNAIVYKEMLKQYMGLGESLATRFTALLVSSPEIIDILATYGLSKEAISRVATVSGVPRREIESLVHAVQQSSKSTKDLMISTVEKLSAFDRVFKSMDQALDAIKQMLSYIFPMLATYLVVRLGKLFGAFEEVRLPSFRDLFGEFWNTFTFAFTTYFKKFSEYLRASTNELNRVPHFQHGGIVPGPVGVPHVAVVHGGEAVIPAWLVEKLRASAQGVVVHTEVHVDKIEGTDVALDEFAQKISDYVVKVVRTELAS